ncbi:hypothetical protein DGG96_17045 [Legionella qingyii]|uniref:Uncharacterized protein n=1 Tax=Legionella qingyii TaxID=2184757 RepID=A0A317TZU6_9GAMM|nr:hypothetical protein [Legionella qingyii]PWY54107.1 hypothetical protein DGG96_18545 [Legionella qingyii]PWY54475.1 hypothetical protein DGG96_17045 [Legionella qingyii]RUR21117.1 hypothetical protein ELY20_13470 [Legionella qingyii]
MNYKDLKCAIDEDVGAITGLQPDIIPARFYYWSLSKLFLNGLLIFWLITSITIAYAGIVHPSNEGLAREAASQVIGESVLMAFFMSAGAMFLLFQALNFYILFRFHLEKRLKTGSLVVKKLKQFSYLFLGVFALFCALFASYGESAAIFMFVGFAFFGSLLVTYFLVSMEISRIGISTIFTLINEFFHKGKKIELPLR